MYIQTNVNAMNILRNYSMHQNNLARAMERLSTGYRINRAADDAAGLAISENMRFQINGLRQASRNIQDGISLIQTAEGATNEIHAMLQRMNVLANQASTGTYTDKDRYMLQLEFNQLREEIMAITNGATFNGIKLLNGDHAIDKDNGKNGLILQTGYEAGNTIAVDMPSLTTAFNGLMNLDISTQAGASAAISEIETSVGNVSMARAKLGASQNRLEHRYNYNMNYIENLSAAESRIRNADMALEMMNFTKASIMLQAATAMLAQANTLPKQLLKLLESL